MRQSAKNVLSMANCERRKFWVNNSERSRKVGKDQCDMPSAAAVIDGPNWFLDRLTHWSGALRRVLGVRPDAVASGPTLASSWVISVIHTGHKKKEE